MFTKDAFDDALKSDLTDAEYAETVGLTSGIVKFGLFAGALLGIGSTS